MRDNHGESCIKIDLGNHSVGVRIYSERTKKGNITIIMKVGSWQQLQARVKKLAYPNCSKPPRPLSAKAQSMLRESGRSWSKWTHRQCHRHHRTLNSHCRRGWVS